MTPRHCIVASVLALASPGCVSGPATPDAPTDDGRGGRITALPTFHGDCAESWQAINALNGSTATEISLAVDDRHAGEQAADHTLDVTIDVAALGMAQPVTQAAAVVDVHVQILNTLYSNRVGNPADVAGTVTVEAFTPPNAATIHFDHVTIDGEDAVVSGTFRCGLDGQLVIESFSRTQIGDRCGEDYECGGAYSGVVCDRSSFVCAPGCHQPADCPIGATCQLATSVCSS